MKKFSLIFLIVSLFSLTILGNFGGDDNYGGETLIVSDQGSALLDEAQLAAVEGNGIFRCLLAVVNGVKSAYQVATAPNMYTITKYAAAIKAIIKYCNYLAM